MNNWYAPDPEKPGRLVESPNPYLKHQLFRRGYTMVCDLNADDVRAGDAIMCIMTNGSVHYGKLMEFNAMKDRNGPYCMLDRFHDETGLGQVKFYAQDDVQQKVLDARHSAGDDYPDMSSSDILARWFKIVHWETFPYGVTLPF